jgi:internalin A
MLAASVAMAAAGCDDDKSDLASKVDASPKPVTTATAPSTYDAAPPPPVVKKPIVCAPGPAVDFHGNTALEAEVRRKLQRDAGAITQSDLKAIKSINLSQVPTDSLDPCVFPLFTGVKDLFLGRGELDDLTPLSTLSQLVTLRASLNKVTDLKPLEKMTQMDRLDLAHTGIHDIGPLSNMTALTELELDGDEVTDLTPLANVKTLERLSIRDTPVVDLSPLKNLKKLRFVYIEGAPIADTNVLNGISGLKIVRKGQM